MATVLKAGAIKIDLEASAKNLVEGFKKAVESLNTFGKSVDTQTSSSKRLDDQLKALERRKTTLEERMKALDSAGKRNTVTYQNISNQLANVNDRIATQNLRISEHNSNLSKSSGVLNGFKSSLQMVGGIGALAMQTLFNSITKVSEIAIGNVLANAVTTVTSKMLTFGKAAFGFSQNLQDTRAGFEAMLGSSEKAKKLLTDLSEYNKKTPFQLPQLQEQASNLLAIGVSADKIIPTLDMLGKISRGSAERMSFLTLAYGQVQTATKLTGSELRQFTENGVPLLDILAKQTGKTTAQMRKDISDGTVSFEMVQKALMSTVEEGGRFYNYFEGQNKNFSFISSNIIDNLQQIGRSILGITEAGDVIDGGLFDRLTTAAQSLLKFIEENKQAIIDFGQNAIAEAINFVKNFKKTIEETKTGFNNLKESIGPVINQFITFFNVVLTNFKPEIAAINSITQALIKTFTENLLPILNIITGVFLFIATQAITSLVYALTVLKEPIIRLVLSLAELWAAFAPIVTIIAGVVAIITAILIPVLQVLWAVVVQVFAGILSTVSGVIKIISGVINLFVGFLLGLITGDFTRFKIGFSQLWEGLVVVVKSVFGLIVNAVIAIRDGIINTIKGINLFDIGMQIMEGLIRGLSSMAGAINKKTEEIAEGIKNKIKGALKIQSPSKVMIEAGFDTGKGLELGLQKSQEGIENQAMSISDLIIKSMEEPTKQETIINKQRNLTINNYDSSRSDRFINFTTAFA